MAYPKKVFLHEVCPRDGWQKYWMLIPTEKKVTAIRSMIDYGVKELELGVVSDDPILSRQYFDFEEVCRQIVPYAKERQVKLNVLGSSVADITRIKRIGIDTVDFFISVSDKFGAGFGVAPDEAFENMRQLTQIPGITVRLALGAVFGCPFGESVPVKKIIQYLERAKAMGITSFGLGDSAGRADPILTEHILNEVLMHCAPNQISLHIHNTEGFGIANCCKALEMGFTRFDVSLAGMGGCPVIPNAKGNIPTEDFVNLLDKMGIESGIDLEKCVEASLALSKSIEAPIISSLSSNTVLKRKNCSG